MTTNFPLRWCLAGGYPRDQERVDQPKRNLGMMAVRNLGMMAVRRWSTFPRQVARHFRVNEQRTIIEANAKLLVRGGSSEVGRQGIEP
jgi:hypothetical protein